MARITKEAVRKVLAQQTAKLCAFCKHMRFDGAVGVGQETTQGESEVIRCGKGHWHIHGIDRQESEYRSCIRKAEKCHDYDESE